MQGIVFSAVASDSAPAGPTSLLEKSKFVRVVFVFSAVVQVTPHRQDQRYLETNPNLSELFVFSAAASDSAPAGPT